MGNFRRDDHKSSGGFGRKSYGGGSGGSRFGGRDGGRPTMHSAVCSECGDSCEVPFKPTGDKPIFCSDCFGRQKSRDGGSSRPSFGGDRRERRERPSFGGGDRQMYDAVCAKCGENCQVPFRPTDSKPVYCSNCFEKGSKDGGRGSEKLNEKLSEINAKLDLIMTSLGLSPIKKAKEVKKVEVKEDKKANEAKSPEAKSDGGKKKAKAKAKAKPATKKIVAKKKK